MKTKTYEIYAITNNQEKYTRIITSDSIDEVEAWHDDLVDLVRKYDTVIESGYGVKKVD